MRATIFLIFCVLLSVTIPSESIKCYVCGVGENSGQPCGKFPERLIQQCDYPSKVCQVITHKYGNYQHESHVCGSTHAACQYMNSDYGKTCRSCDTDGCNDNNSSTTKFASFALVSSALLIAFNLRN